MVNIWGIKWMCRNAYVMTLGTVTATWVGSRRHPDTYRKVGYCIQELPEPSHQENCLCRCIGKGDPRHSGGQEGMEIGVGGWI